MVRLQYDSRPFQVPPQSLLFVKMPDNTWFTPYKLPASRCLSFGPSQGIVYKLSEKSVVKLPFQYPISDVATDDATEHMYLSLRSFAVFKKESQIYDLLPTKPHPNITQRRKCDHQDCIILERLDTVEYAWSASTKKIRLNWIQQLLMALEWIEKLGYTHGDITIRNLGIDYNNQLKLFDFGSVMRCDDDNFHNQVLEDHFNLATCLHFLASGIDPLAKGFTLKNSEHRPHQFWLTPCPFVQVPWLHNRSRFLPPAHPSHVSP
jgi:hypothetical protein